jgi:hypothetical protein
MSSRGAYGFRLNEKDYITHSKYDSYPTGLLFRLMKQLKTIPNEHLSKGVNKIQLINSNKKISITDYSLYKNHPVINSICENNDLKFKRNEIWSTFLIDDSDILRYFAETPFSLMVDYSNYVYNSLFCEYAYIINLDTNMVEVYKGYNQFFYLDGRYAMVTDDYLTSSNQNYGGCYFVGEIPLELIYTTTDSQLNIYCQRMYQLIQDYCNKIQTLPIDFTSIYN